MKRAIIVLSFNLAACLLLNIRANAQSLPVGTPVLDDYYRRNQLIGKADSNQSFTVRPIYPFLNLEKQSIYNPDTPSTSARRTFAKGLGSIEILPLSLQQQFNSDHPYGWNDGAMIPAKGYQAIFSGGFYLKYGILSIQFKPEFVYAANSSYKGFATAGRSDADLQNYYSYHNYIDDPERGRTGAYHRAFLGQSNIMLTLGSVVMGLSNENVWWGPGIRNALLLSNNAPGFKHLTLNTVKPLKTFMGSFEGQVIAAKLESTGLSPLNTTTTSTGTNLYSPKRNDWRYYTGFNINYHPKFIDGLTLGLTRVFNAYHQDVKGLSGYIPFFARYSKLDSAGSDAFDRDQLTSVYARWVFTKAQAEVYFEYGLNDNANNLKDLFGSPDHSRAYIFGFRKMIKLNKYKDQYILFSTEVTQLSQSIDRTVRDASGWYIHHQIRDGQTNQGQTIGAGTGSGGNLQSMDISWVHGLKKLEIQVERYEHDVDFYQASFPDINGNSRNWVDFAFAMIGEWNYKNLLFNAKLQRVKSLNYQWVLKDYVPGDYYVPHNDVYNFHAELGVTFRF